MLQIMYQNPIWILTCHNCSINLIKMFKNMDLSTITLICTSFPQNNLEYTDIPDMVTPDGS